MFDCFFSSRNLIAHQAHGGRIRTNENQVVGFASLGQFGAFGKESVARMDGIGTSIQGRIDNLLYVEVGVFQCAITQGVRFIGHAPM